MAKTDKPAAGKPAGGEPSDGKSDRTINIVLVCAVVAAALVGGYFYFVRGASQNDPNAPKKDPDLAELMTPPAGLQDVSIGSQDAPNVIVEYASMGATPRSCRRPTRRTTSCPRRRSSPG